MPKYLIKKLADHTLTEIESNWFGGALNKLLGRKASFFTLENKKGIATCRDRIILELYTVEKLK